MPLKTRDEFDALVESILRCQRLAPVGTCGWIGPDLTHCGRPERSAGASLCSWHFMLARAAEEPGEVRHG